MTLTWVVEGCEMYVPLTVMILPHSVMVVTQHTPKPAAQVE